jgi:hypothetical protein
MPDYQKFLAAVNASAPRDRGCRTVREVLSSLRRVPVKTPLYVASPPGGPDVPWNHDGTGHRHFLPITGGTTSYRGYYEDIAVEYGEFNDQPATAGDLVKHLNGRVGTDMIGYKGGDFPIHNATLTWVSRHSNVEEMRIDRFVRADSALVIVTERGGRGGALSW